MFEEFLARLKINPKELTSQLIVSARGIKELNKVYHRIEKQLQEPDFHQKRKYWSYDIIIKHSTKVALYALALARTGDFTAKECLRVAVAGLLHDVDKFYWSVELLDTPSMQLAKNDWTGIMEHAVAGAVFVEKVARKHIAPEVLEIIRQHHENFNGTGYPKRLAGEKILPGARIIRLVNSYDTMTSPRPYKKGVQKHEDAISALKHRSGSVYDPKIMKLFESTLTIEKIKELRDLGEDSGFRKTLTDQV